ncbi:MAG: hypothetical protein JWN08_3283 [Frankiales bacterium]|nr:hypothetical protein [Frankiales bacterium]
MNGLPELSAGDWARYAGLVALASLLFLVVYGDRDGALVSLLAVYVVAGTAGAVVVRARGDQS